ncbi:MAG: hypothetical protein AAGC97_08235 [Planctomycetota bacterium]
MKGTPSPSPRLRSDLRAIAMPGNRTILVVDEIAGRFSRIPRYLWLRLSRGGEASPSQWRDAHQAGLVRQRASVSRGDRQSILSFKIPLFSLDSVAAFVAPAFRFVFTPAALLAWTLTMMIAMFIILMRWGSWSGSGIVFRDHLASLSIGHLAGLFLVTKSLHELGHAVACYRMGSRVGKLGIWFLCFFPCPYVDVTNVWRDPSRLRRAAVMAAGIWVEWVVACLAAWCWILSKDSQTQLAAMNVVLICGVSTVAFNANPLMRFDGYYVLSDFLDSTDLRREASLAFRKVFLGQGTSRRVARAARDRLLALYHVTARAYQVILLAVIASMLLAWSDRLGLVRIGSLLMVAFAVQRGAGWLRGSRWLSVQKTTDLDQSNAPPLARFPIRKAALLAVVIVIVVIPLPRYAHCRARLIAADVRPIYLPPQGTVGEVRVVIGKRVDIDEVLAVVKAPRVLLDHLDAQRRVASLQHDMKQVQLVALRSHKNPEVLELQRWRAIESALGAATETEAQLEAKRDRLTVASPATGVVLTGVPFTGEVLSRDDAVGEIQSDLTDFVAYPNRLMPGCGEAVDQSKAWCRVASSTKLEARWEIPVELRDRIVPGRAVRLHTEVSNRVLHATVERISSSRDASGSSPSASRKPYRVFASIAASSELPQRLDDLVIWDGSQCEAVVHLPWRSIADDLWGLLVSQGWTG